MEAGGPGGMTDFHGEDSTGQWSLTIADSIAPNSGTLNAWSLLISDAPGGPAVPVNDVCEFSTLIFDDSTTPFDTSLATASGFVSSCSGLPPIDVWYILEIPCPGDYTASTCGSSFDTVITIWDGTAACPTMAHTPTACSDDTCGPQSEVTWFADTGGAYYIQIGGAGATGSGVLTVSSNASPLNDDCPNASTIFAGATPFDTACASAEGLPLPCGLGPPIDLWFEYTATCDGELRVDSFDSDFDTVLAIWSGGSCASPGEVPTQCSDDAGSTTQSEVVLDVSIGESYLIQVGGATGATIGSGTLTISCVPSSAGLFRRADSNADGAFDISDPVFLLNVLFGGIAVSCADAHDTNDDGANDIADVVFGLVALFTLGAPQPAAPGVIGCGSDPTADPLRCDSFDCP